MLSRLACSHSLLSASFLKESLKHVPKQRQMFRNYARETRDQMASRTRSERMTLRERAMAPPGENGK